MAESYEKKEIAKKKLIKQRAKEEKRALKKEHNNKGKSLEEMIVYVDMFGQFTDIPPHLQDRTLPGDRDASGRRKPMEYFGVINNITDKGYGFIKEDGTKEQIFYHNSNLQEPVSSGDRVTYKKEVHDGRNRAIEIVKIAK